MSSEAPDDLTDEERVLFGTFNTAYELALQCRQLADMNVSVSKEALEIVIATLMTEFWDQGFSQTEIREAFLTSFDGLKGYAPTERPE